MADALAEFLSQKIVGEFTPAPFYEKITDALIFYARDESSYSKRLTKYFTVFLANSDDTLVGFEIKGIKTILRAIENLGDVDIVKPVTLKDEDGEVFDLSAVAHFALSPDEDGPVSGDNYEKMTSVARGVRVRRDLCES